MESNYYALLFLALIMVASVFGQPVSTVTTVTAPTIATLDLSAAEDS